MKGEGDDKDEDKENVKDTDEDKDEDEDEDDEEDHLEQQSFFGHMGTSSIYLFCFFVIGVF